MKSISMKSTWILACLVIVLIMTVLHRRMDHKSDMPVKVVVMLPGTFEELEAGRFAVETSGTRQKDVLNEKLMEYGPTDRAKVLQERIFAKDGSLIEDLVVFLNRRSTNALSLVVCGSENVSIRVPPGVRYSVVQTGDSNIAVLECRAKQPQ